MNTTMQWFMLVVLAACATLAFSDDSKTRTDWNDPAFDRYVPMLMLGRAIDQGDSQALLDAALQLRGGEDVLLRTHKSGITSEVLLQKALRAARDNHDTATLARLKGFAQTIADPALLNDIQQSEKLADVSRNSETPLLVSPESMTAQDFATIKDLSDGIRTAGLVGEREYLDAAEERLQYLDLDETQKEVLRERIQQARQQMPDTPAAADVALSKLAGFSRQIGGNLVKIVTGRETPEDIRRLDPTSPIWRESHDSGYTGSWAIESGPSTPPQRPTIDSNGNVWAGSPVRGRQGKFAGKAQIAYNANGQAFWQSSYQDRYGTPSAIPAPAYNKNFDALKSYQSGQPMTAQQARQQVEWQELYRQGKTRPTIYGDMRRP